MEKSSVVMPTDEKTLKITLILVLLLLTSIQSIYCKNLISIETDNSVETIFFYYPFDNYVNKSLATKVFESEKNLYKVEFDLAFSNSVVLSIDDKLIKLFLTPNDTTSIYVNNVNNSFGKTDLMIKFLNGTNKEGQEYFNLNFQHDIKLALSKIRFYLYSHRDKEETVILSDVLKIIKDQTAWIDKLLAQSKMSKEYADLLKNEINALFLNEFIEATSEFYEYKPDDPNSYEKGKQLRKLLREILSIDESLIDKSYSASAYYYHKCKELFHLYPERDYELSNFPHDYKFDIYKDLPPKLKMYLIGTALIEIDKLLYLENQCRVLIEYIRISNHKAFNNYMSNRCL